ncbi:glycoside hydrolase family 88 protein [soil metagenome]
MNSLSKWALSIVFVLVMLTTQAQTTWVDTLDLYARTEYLPPNKYKWTWVNAALLSVMVNRYDRAPEQDKATYLAYVKTAMDHTYGKARGKTPNGVASGLGMAFLYRVTKEEKYLKKSLEIYNDYLKIKRTANGGVSHLRLFYELWDDTVFMIGEYLMQMYLATGDEKYLDEFMSQFRIHRGQLRDTTTNLWVHGWDADSKAHITFCSQNKWQNHPDRRSKEFWGRGNGWIVVTLSDALQNIPKEHKYWPEFAGYLKEMVEVLPPLQDSATGHWYQLPIRKAEAGNYLESSCTAMFAYGILTAQKLGIVTGPAYTQAVDRTYKGLPEHSLVPVSGGYLTTQNVCKGTCIGDSQYYYARKSQQGKAYAIGMFIQFGRAWEAR